MTSKRFPAASVRACPQCGSDRLESSYGPADPILAGTNLGLLTCLQCGRQVVPVSFPSETERERFAKGRSHSRRPEPAPLVPGVATARMDAAISIVFSILIGAGLVYMGQPLIGLVLLAAGIALGLSFLRR